VEDDGSYGERGTGQKSVCEVGFFHRRARGERREKKKVLVTL